LRPFHLAFVDREKVFNGVANIANIVLCEFREHGERYDSFSLLLGDREIPFRVTEIGICVLEMQRYGIVKTGGYSLIVKELSQIIPLIYLNNEQVIYGTSEFGFSGKLYSVHIRQ
jgi:hypothetical protein